VEDGQSDPFGGSDGEAIEELQKLLAQSVTGQMIADVPLGAFLSGGIDSSAVVALMQAHSSSPIKTFTIGFHDTAFNEATQARKIASHLGTDHTELYVTPDEAIQVIPRLPELYDEPFSDSSQIPTFLVSQLAKQQVTVSLSGDGGDELFGGYNRHHWAAYMWKRIGYLPRPLRAVLAGVIQALPPKRWDAVFMSLDNLLPRSMRQRNPGDKLHKLAEIVAARGQEEVYLNLVSHWNPPGTAVKNGVEPESLITKPNCQGNLGSFENSMMYLDTVTYLPDDILTKVDRAAMGVSLESRVPMLDHRLVEFAWRLPLDMKIRNGQGKWALRQMLYRYVPQDVVDRPKAGFGLPVGDWLRGPLREWAELLLGEDRLATEGFFNPEPIRNCWGEHLSGKYNRAYHLWDVLMFQSWLEQEGIQG
jgi:asparagine synthase (glutamine-hydrolysing)